MFVRQIRTWLAQMSISKCRRFQKWRTFSSQVEYFDFSSCSNFCKSLARLLSSTLSFVNRGNLKFNNQQLEFRGQFLWVDREGILKKFQVNVIFWKGNSDRRIAICSVYFVPNSTSLLLGICCALTGKWHVSPFANWLLKQFQFESFYCCCYLEN